MTKRSFTTTSPITIITRVSFSLHTKNLHFEEGLECGTISAISLFEAMNAYQFQEEGPYDIIDNNCAGKISGS